jgi:hypothetical protein
MKYFFVKLLTPRPDFRMTMTDAERAIMGAHQAYMAEMHQRGWAIAYGPVADATGDYGAGFWAVPDDVDLTSVIANDPAIRANAGFGNEVHPMPALVFREVEEVQSA